MFPARARSIFAYDRIISGYAGTVSPGAAVIPAYNYFIPACAGIISGYTETIPRPRYTM